MSTIQINNVCFCGKPKVITAQDAEIICKNCGVTFGYDEYYEMQNTIPYYFITKTKLNPYQSRQTECNPYDTKRLTQVKIRTSRNNQDIKGVFDVCSKLNLSNTISEECWNQYTKLQKSKLTRAQSICLAIYQTCRLHHIPFSEHEIKDMVCQSLGVKKAPMLKNIIFKIGKGKCSIEPIAGKDAFYLNFHLSQAQKDHKIEDISILRRITTRYYENLTDHSSL